MSLEAACSGCRRLFALPRGASPVGALCEDCEGRRELAAGSTGGDGFCEACGELLHASGVCLACHPEDAAAMMRDLARMYAATYAPDCVLCGRPTGPSPTPHPDGSGLACEKCARWLPILELEPRPRNPKI